MTEKTKNARQKAILHRVHCRAVREMSEEAGKMSAAISEGATRYALSEAGSERRRRGSSYMQGPAVTSQLSKLLVFAYKRTFYP